MNLSERKVEFQKLDYNKKKQKILTFLYNIKTYNSIIQETINIIQKHTNIDENFLEETYSDLIEFAYLIDKNEEEKAERKIINIRKKIENIQTREAEERDIENIDNILEKI